MFDRVWLVCFRCKCEFFVEAARLQVQPGRACPNCGTIFDQTGLGLLAEGLRMLGDASRSVTFRLEEGQKLVEAARTVQIVHAADQEPRLYPPSGASAPRSGQRLRRQLGPRGWRQSARA